MTRVAAYSSVKCERKDGSGVFWQERTELDVVDYERPIWLGLLWAMVHVGGSRRTGQLRRLMESTPNLKPPILQPSTHDVVLREEDRPPVALL